MWTVTVTLPTGDTEEFADQRRLSPSYGGYANSYSYEVDSSTDVLRVYKQGYNWFGDNNGWDSHGSKEEVAYFRPHQWDRVRGA